MDVTAFITSKHFEVHAFYNTYRGQNSLDAAYIGQSLLPTEYSLNVVDVEAQYIDDEHLKYVDNSLHLGLGVPLQGGQSGVPVEDESPRTGSRPTSTTSSGSASRWGRASSSRSSAICAATTSPI